MDYEIKYVPLSLTAEGGAEGEYSGRLVNADSPAEAVIAFSGKINEAYPNRKVAVNKNKVSLPEEDIQLIEEQGIEYRKGIEPPDIEIVAVEKST